MITPLKMAQHGAAVGMLAIYHGRKPDKFIERISLNGVDKSNDANQYAKHIFKLVIDEEFKKQDGISKKVIDQYIQTLEDLENYE